MTLSVFYMIIIMVHFNEMVSYLTTKSMQVTVFGPVCYDLAGSLIVFLHSSGIEKVCEA